MATTASRLEAMYRALYGRFGPQQWWPAQSPFEVVVGAVLTQNTNWSNVEKALARLRDLGLLSLPALLSIPEVELAGYIKPSGYFNVKARRLRSLLLMIEREYDSSLERLLAEETMAAREKLLSVKGIGPETADSILLYAGNHPIFVVDAYTHRIMSRHALVPEECDYRTLQDLFMDNLAPDPLLFNEYHALLVKVGKQFCKKNKPLCSDCPLFEE